MKQHILSILTLAVLSAATVLPVMADERHERRGEARGEDRHEMRREARPEGRHEMRNEVRERRNVRGWGEERDIRHFENHHLSIWRSGGWHHGRHDGRLGWWWVVAGTWYFYPVPIYPYPDPYIPPYVVVQPAPETAAPAAQPPAQSWYYCEASKSYYPYVSSCPAGWKAVPATPPSPQAK